MSFVEYNLQPNVSVIQISHMGFYIQRILDITLIAPSWLSFFPNASREYKTVRCKSYDDFFDELSSYRWCDEEICFK